MRLKVTYYMHSGFSCAKDRVLLVFDYWRGEQNELPEAARITPDFLRGFDEVYVFISHSHPDHWDPIVATWRTEVPEAHVTYIMSNDMPTGSRGLYMKPGETHDLGRHVTVTAFPSTDLGVSYLVTLDGFRIFHAGDLNFWHWREESTLQEIEEAEQEFYAACKPIEQEIRENGVFDIAFFPVDARQGRLFDAGANYFVMSCKPRLLVPMHFWERAEIATEFARRSRTSDTEVVAMTRAGEQIELDMADNGFMTILLPPPVWEIPPQERVPDDPDEGEGNPFDQTDLPVVIR